jgi:hypothetical protein
MSVRCTTPQSVTSSYTGWTARCNGRFDEHQQFCSSEVIARAWSKAACRSPTTGRGLPIGGTEREYGGRFHL